MEKGREEAIYAERKEGQARECKQIGEGLEKEQNLHNID